jgi:hypothetical protein
VHVIDLRRPSSSSRAPLAGSRTGGKLARRAPCDAPPCVDPRDQDRRHTAPCGASMSNDRDAFRRVAIDRVTPAAGATSAIWLDCAARPRAPFSPRSHRPCASARVAESYLGQRRAADLPCGSSCITTRDASDRLLPSHVFVRVPAPRGFPTRRSACALRAIGEIACLTSVRFASVGRTVLDASS